MEYVYGAMLLHAVGKEIDEENLKKVMEASGAGIEETRVKALVSSLEGVDIEEAIKNAAPIAAAPVAAAPAEQKAEAKEEEEEEEKGEEEAAAGLASLFG